MLSKLLIDVRLFVWTFTLERLMRTALFSSTLVVNYRALTLQGIFCGGSNIGIYNWSMHEYLPTIWLCITVNTEDMILISHFAYQWILLVKWRRFVLVLRSNWFLKLTTFLTTSHTHFLSISYYFLLQYETDRLSIVRYWSKWGAQQCCVL